MTNLIAGFIDAQKAFWNETTFDQKCNTFSVTAVAGMGSYVFVNILENSDCWDFIHKVSSMMFRLREIAAPAIQSTIAINFAALFYSQNLKGKVALWKVSAGIMSVAYLYCSTVKGNEIKKKRNSN